MSNQLVVSTKDLSCLELTSKYSDTQNSNYLEYFDDLKLSSQLPPDGSSPPKQGHIIKYLENILNNSHLKLNTFSYKHYKMCSDLNF